MEDLTVAGLRLSGDNDIATPLEAVVCIKGLDENGSVCHWSRCTEGLTLTEAQGMALGLLDDLRDARRET